MSVYHEYTHHLDKHLGQDTWRQRYADIMWWLVICSDGFSAEQKATFEFVEILCDLRMHMVKKKFMIFWKAAYNKKHSHFFSQSREKETVPVDLLYYDNLKPVSDIVLTQELQIFALLACSIIAYYLVWDFGVYFLR